MELEHYLLFERCEKCYGDGYTQVWEDMHRLIDCFGNPVKELCDKCYGSGMLPVVKNG